MNTLSVKMVIMFKISVVTLTFNSERTVADTVKSVLSQSHPHIEHVIIDNVSTDSTLQIVRDLYAGSSSGEGEAGSKELKIVSEKDQGISDGFNKGIAASTGEVIVFLNSDDTYADPSVIEKVANAFQDPQVMFVHGDMYFEDDEYGSNRRKPLFCDLGYGMPFNHPTMFIRRSLYEEIGVFDLSYRYAMDFHLVCRMYSSPHTCRYKGVYLEEPCFVNMRAGGISDIQELRSIDDVERALKETKHFNLQAAYYLLMRRFRIRLKKILSKVGLTGLVKVWRRLKWG